MDPGCYYYSPSDGDFFRPRTEIRNDSHFTIISSNGFANDCLSNAILALWLAQSLKELCAVRVSVGVAMGHVDFTVVIFELNGESQCVVKTATLLLQRILEVADVLAISIPSIA